MREEVSIKLYNTTCKMYIVKMISYLLGLYECARPEEDLSVERSSRYV